MARIRCALCAAVAILGSAAAASAASDAKFAGKNIKAGYIIKFKVVGSEIRDKQMFWRAHCRSGQRLSRGTATARLSLVHGQWSGHGRYSAQLPYAPHMVGRFNVIEDNGSINRHHAEGVFHLKVSLYIRGHLSDKCDTGVIRWSAKRKG